MPQPELESEPDARSAEPPNLPLILSPLRLAILSSLTLGIYDIYWFFRNWKAIEPSATTRQLLLRAVFAPFTYASFLTRAQTPNGVEGERKFLAPALFYASFALCFVLRGLFWQGRLFMFLPLLHAQERLKQKFRVQREGDSFEPLDALWILPGVALLIHSLWWEPVSALTAIVVGGLMGLNATRTHRAHPQLWALGGLLLWPMALATYWARPGSQDPKQSVWRLYTSGQFVAAIFVATVALQTAFDWTPNGYHSPKFASIAAEFEAHVQAEVENMEPLEFPTRKSNPAIDRLIMMQRATRDTIAEMDLEPYWRDHYFEAEETRRKAEGQREIDALINGYSEQLVSRTGIIGDRVLEKYPYLMSREGALTFAMEAVGSEAYHNLLLTDLAWTAGFWLLLPALGRPLARKFLLRGATLPEALVPRKPTGA